MKYLVLGALLSCTACATAPSAPSLSLEPSQMAQIGEVDERFQSYNVEMAEVVGARFWAPYNADGSPPTDLFEQRPPLDLRGNVRLRNLARALGPAYMRVSGSWANNTLFQDDDPHVDHPPTGIGGVLTRDQWAGVVDFAAAVDAEIVTSFPVGAIARNEDGSWNPDRARRLLRYTRELGGEIAAIAPINEPTLGAVSGLPRGYDAAAFARDNAAFRALIESEAPGTRIVGPTSAAEAGNYVPPRLPIALSTEAMLSAEPRPRFDVFSYHFYTSASKRCGLPAATPDVALSEGWLALVERAHLYYAAYRDRFLPGAPIWITEIGEASCGGDPWAASFVDTFRYVDNMARLAKLGAAAMFHNTLAASDYALIDDRTWEPRPSYWAAVLWRRLMGRTVLDAGALQDGLHVYAHCLRDRPRGVALVAINLDQSNPATVRLPVNAQRYTLSAEALESRVVQLNGVDLAMDGDNLPALTPNEVRAGVITLDPATITFFAAPEADNPACG